MKVEEIEIDKIFPNEYNPNEMDKKTFDNLKSEIKKSGMVQPLLIRPKGKSPSGLKTFYEIIDGEHRWKASKEVGLKKIWAAIVETSKEEQMIKTINMNLLRGVTNPDKLKNLLKTLSNNQDLNLLSKSLYKDEKELKFLLEENENLSNQDLSRLIHGDLSTSDKAALYKSFKPGIPPTDIEGQTVGLRPSITFWFEKDSNIDHLIEYFMSDEFDWKHRNELNSNKLLEMVKTWKGKMS